MRPDRRYEELVLGVRHVTVPDHDGSAIAFADESGE
jgi:hypothetical protein